MSERELPDVDLGEEDRALLTAWRSTRAPDAAKAKALALALPPPEGAGPEGAGGTGTTTAPGSSGAFGKLALALVGTGLVGGAVLLAYPRAQPAAVQSPAVLALSAPASASSSGSLSMAADTASVVIAVENLPASSAPVPREPSARRAPDDSLAAQLAELDSIRNDLGKSEIARATMRLDRFDALYPKTPLREESAILRFDALVAGGRRAAAADVARAFVHDYPTSPSAPRLTRWLDENR